MFDTPGGGGIGGESQSSPAMVGDSGRSSIRSKCRDSLMDGGIGGAIRTSDIVINAPPASTTATPVSASTKPPSSVLPAAAAAAAAAASTESPLARAASLLLEEARLSGDFQEVANPYCKGNDTTSPANHRPTARVPPVVAAAAAADRGGDGGGHSGDGGDSGGAVPRVTMRKGNVVRAAEGSSLPKLRPLSVRYPSEDELIEAVLLKQRSPESGDVVETAGTAETAAAAATAAAPAVAPPTLSHLGDDDELKLKRRCEGLIRLIRLKAPEISATHVHKLYAAAATYVAADEDEMSFTAKDEMLVHRQDDDGLVAMQITRKKHTHAYIDTHTRARAHKLDVCSYISKLNDVCSSTYSISTM